MSDTNLGRRGFLALTGGTVAAFSLAACFRDGDSSTPEKVGKSFDMTARQTIEVWDFDATGIDAWVDADKQFDAYFKDTYPNVTVNKTKAAFTGFAEALLTSVAGGKKYDVIYGWAPWLPQFKESGVVDPLTAYIEADPVVSPDLFYDYGKDELDGEVYGLGWYASAEFLYYNKTVVAAAGVPDPAELDASGTWTYDALKTFVEAVSTSGSKPVYGFDMGVTRGTGDYGAFAKGWGTDLWNDDQSGSLLASDENVALWSWIQDFYNEKSSPLPSEGSGLAESVGFGDQRILMFVSGANYFRTADQQNVDDLFDIGLVRIPKGPGGQSAVTYVNSYFMGAQGGNRGAGWEWYKERTFSDKARELYTVTGASRFPVRRDQEPVTVYDFEDADLFKTISKDMYKVPAVNNQAKFDEAYGASWDELVLGGSPEKLLGELATTSTSLVKA
jgi:multiple sugar transport system substrate-binding protein